MLGSCLALIKKLSNKLIHYWLVYPGWLNFHEVIRWLFWRNRNEPTSLRHYLSERKLSDALSIMQKSNFHPMVTLGTLLGAIRDSSFSGRPADIDLLLLCPEESEIELLKSLFSESGYTVSQSKNKYVVGTCLKVAGRGPVVDIIIPFLCRENKDWVQFIKKNGKTYTFFYDDLRNPQLSRIFSTEVLVPRCPEGYLVAWYGADWQTPQRKRPVSNYMPEERVS